MSHPPPPCASILDAIGNTPLLELRHLVPRNAGRVLIKLESANPSGSMKDRMALAMIEAAERDGRLPAGGPVVEYTGGSTGVSLAQVCRAKGHPLFLVTNDVVSPDKRGHMRALGATVTVLESSSGKLEESLTRRMIDAAARIQADTGAYWTDQLNNADQIGGYETLGEELWTQTNEAIDAFVQCVGTGGSLRGVGGTLREHDATVRLTAIEPAESAVLSGRPSGPHQIEGVGAGFVVPLWDPDLVDAVATVSTDDAMAMCRRLAAEEALFAGTSTGANVTVALATALRLGPGTTTVCLACDTGMKYLGTRLYGPAAGAS
ncbi:MAG: cysteine synthase family protein [Phycisphaerales bacterium]|nr:cysteine synthase family protein [Phycisphaerae bacterium]NNF44138.1 cysteine synthase family protein [Phycisphaerales bacterium]NNM24514.1 cysteine synthase family protein [Phycisphaerales bacterium]